MSNQNENQPHERKPHQYDGLFTCYKCKIPMHYKGERHSMVAVCVQKYDSDGDPYTADEMVNAPYATWKCPNCGHIETDGY